MDLGMHAIANAASSPNQIRRHDLALRELKTLAAGRIPEACTHILDLGMELERKFEFKKALGKYGEAIELLPAEKARSAVSYRLRHCAARCAYYMAYYTVAKEHLAFCSGLAEDGMVPAESATLHGDYGCILRG
jgi:hypothetical protein